MQLAPGATGTEIDDGPIHHVLAVVVEEIGIGLVVGLVLTAAATFAFRAALGRDWLAGNWRGITVVALAIACFAAAQALGGSGFIACSVG